jgi:hypothetical protein
MRRERAARPKGEGLKYLLTFVVQESGMDDATPEEMTEGLERWSAFDREATERGVLIACEPLENSAATTTIRLQDDGGRLVVDGPFAGAIEVRPVMDLSGGQGFGNPTLAFP